MRPPSLLRSKGRNAFVVAISPKTFVSKVVRHVLERLFAHFLCPLVRHHARVVDQDVEPSEVALDLVRGFLDALGIADIDHNRMSVDPIFTQPFCGSFPFP